MHSKHPFLFNVLLQWLTRLALTPVLDDINISEKSFWYPRFSKPPWFAFHHGRKERDNDEVCSPGKVRAGAVERGLVIARVEEGRHEF